MNDFKKHLNINDETSKIVGFTPDYIGIQPGKRNTKPNIFNQFILENINNEKFIKGKYYKHIIDTLSNYREVWSGSYDTNSSHLSNFFKQNTTKLDVEDIIKIISKCDWFQSPTHNFNRPSEMFYCMNFNPKASNGHYTSKLLGSNLKGDTYQASIYNAFNLYELIKKKPMKNYAIWDILSREKQIKPNAETLSTRVIWTTEETQTYLLSWFSNFILKEMQIAKGSKFKAPISGEFDGEKASKIIDAIDNYDYIIDADWSKFDSTIDTQFLIVAGLVMFGEIATYSKEHMRMAFYYISSLTTKYVAIPPGIVVNCTRGNPSGHPGVTIINCIVNMIRWAIIGYEIYGEYYADNMELFVYGDDSFILFKHNDKIFKIDEITAKHGFVGDPIIKNIFPTKLYHVDTDTSPDFLKRRATLFGVKWNVEKILVTICYQSKPRNFGEQIDTIVDFIKTAPCDNDFNFLILEFLLWCKEQFFYNEFKDIIDDSIDIVNSYIQNVNEFSYDKKVDRFVPKFRTEENLIENLNIANSNTSFNVEIYNPDRNDKLVINDLSVNCNVFAAFLFNFNSSELLKELRDEMIKMFNINLDVNTYYSNLINIRDPNNYHIDYYRKKLVKLDTS